jgi:hypothetical protein
MGSLSGTRPCTERARVSPSDRTSGTRPTSVLCCPCSKMTLFLGHAACLTIAQIRVSEARSTCIDEGGLSFVTAVCCTYIDYQYKLEYGGIMTEGPRLGRPG